MTETRRRLSAEEFEDAVHDVYDGYGGADLAVVLPAPSGSFQLSETPPLGPRVVAAWPVTEGLFESGFVRLDAFRRAAHAVTDPASRSTVALLKFTANDEVKALAEELGYSPAIEGQIDGYWLGPADDVPRSRPRYLPTGAVLPLAGEPDRECLVLVLIEHEWRVLSTAAVSTYRHTLGLAAGEQWRFATYADAEAPATVYEAQLLPAIAPDELGKRYGESANARARQDKDAVVLRLSKVGGG